MKVKGNLIIDGDLIADNISGGSTVTFTDGINSISSNTLNFNNNDFYLSTNLSGQPVTNKLFPVDDFKFKIELPAVSSYTFNIPTNTTTSMIIYYHLRTSLSSTFDTTRVRLNNDSGDNYSRVRSILNDNSGTTWPTVLFQPSGLAGSQTEFVLGQIPAASSDNASLFGTGKMVFAGHSSTDHRTTVKAFSSGCADIGSGTPVPGQKARNTITIGTWDSTAIITSITFRLESSATFASGSYLIVIGY